MGVNIVTAGTNHIHNLFPYHLVFGTTNINLFIFLFISILLRQ